MQPALWPHNPFYLLNIVQKLNNANRWPDHHRHAKLIHTCVSRWQTWEHVQTNLVFILIEYGFTHPCKSGCVFSWGLWCSVSSVLCTHALVCKQWSHVWWECDPPYQKKLIIDKTCNINNAYCFNYIPCWAFWCSVTTKNQGQKKKEAKRRSHGCHDMSARKRCVFTDEPQVICLCWDSTLQKGWVTLWVPYQCRYYCLFYPSTIEQLALMCAWPDRWMWTCQVTSESALWSNFISIAR